MLNQARTYIEVGVQEGNTFNDPALDSLPVKIAVDPKFMFDISDGQRANGREYYQCSSDRYFTEFHPSNQSLDLVYLDGLHTFDQTYRDFCNTLCYASWSTIWLIDDVLPLSLAQAEPDLGRANELKRAIGEDHGWWMGDVYKIVAAIHDYYPSLSFGLLSDGNNAPGQLVVWFEKRSNFKPFFSSIGEISSLGYQDFLILKSLGHIYNPLGWDAIVTSIKASMMERT